MIKLSYYTKKTTDILKKYFSINSYVNFLYNSEKYPTVFYIRHPINLTFSYLLYYRTLHKNICINLC